LTPTKPEGWHGWDAYARFYDWENRQTLGRRDIRFWQALARRAGGPVLELGCGTGRVSLPVARTGVAFVGVDRSADMLARARARFRRGGLIQRAAFVRADIRSLPFAADRFASVMAPYGILQSLVRESDLTRTLESVSRVIAPDGTFAIDLVPDVPRWREHGRRPTLRGRLGRSAVTLMEAVRQDARRRLTHFEQEYVERPPSGRRQVHRFTLTFRTLSIAGMTRRLDRAGFRIDAVLGDYRGRAWDERADVWVIVARRRAAR
jgi:SAM-dependent methyltransferase